jgi:linoleate 10R-lipoxygenase
LQIGIPLKTKENPKGLFTDQEVYDMLTLLFTVSVLDVKPEVSWTLQHGAQQIATVVQQLIEQNLEEVTPSVRIAHLRVTIVTDFNSFRFYFQNPLMALVGAVSNWIWPTEAKKPYHAFLAKLKASGRPTQAIVGQVIGISVASVTLYAQSVAQVVDFYMDDARAKERAEIVRLANEDSSDPAQKALLLGYVREGQSESSSLKMIRLFMLMCPPKG